MKSGPPRVAQYLLGQILKDGPWQTPLGDFEEFYRAVADEQGLSAARRWYSHQVAGLLGPWMMKTMMEGADMLKNYMMMAGRHFRRQRAYGVINIIGLIIGMTVALLFLSWVRDERAFDSFHEQKDSIYRVVADWEQYGWDGLEMTPAPLGPLAVESLPQVECASRVWFQNRQVFRTEDRFFYESQGLFVDADFFKMFTFPLADGQGVRSLESPDDLYITASMARRYFNSVDVIGKTIQADDRDLSVCGVLEDIPRQSTLQFAYVQSFDHMKEISDFNAGWQACQFTLFLKVRPGSNLEELGAQLTELAKSNGSSHAASGVTFRLQPLEDIHLDARPYDRKAVVLGDGRVVMLFIWIAVAAVLLASVNFINLSTARAMTRAREVGLRKTVGARRGQLMGQFLSETFLFSLAAMVAALALSALLMPWFNMMTGKELTFSINDSGLWGLAALMVMGNGLLAGLYPAFVLSEFKPVAVLKPGQIGGTRGSRLRQILVVFQFSVALVLMIVTLAAGTQFRYMQDKALGFDKEHVLTVPLKGAFAEHFHSVKDELLTSAAISSVSGVWNDISSQTWGSASKRDFEGRQGEAREVDLVMTGVDYDYFKTLNLHVADGRAFEEAIASDGDNIMLNQAAVNRIGIESPVGKWMKFSGKKRIILGVVPDAHYRTLKDAVRPRIYFLQDMARCQSDGIALIRFRAGQADDALAHLKTVFEKSNPSTPFEFAFLDQTYELLYQSEQRLNRLLSLLTAIGVLIASMGLLGLAAFMVQRRLREIGIRKVLGAKTSAIWRTLTRQFVISLLLANVIAWPVANWMISRGLESYEYRIRPDITLFLIPGVVLIVLALATVSAQMFRGLRIQPSQVLRQD